MLPSTSMRAVCWEGKEKIKVETVPDPVILNPRDAIVKVTTAELEMRCTISFAEPPVTQPPQ